MHVKLFDRFAVVVDLFKAAERMKKVDGSAAFGIYQQVYYIGRDLLEDIEDAGEVHNSYYTRLKGMVRVASDIIK